MSTDGRLVLGAAVFGQPYGSGAERRPPDDATVCRLLAAAESAGVTHLDTARAYGESEAAIGRARASHCGSALRIVTKIRPLDALDVGASADDVAAAVRASFAESRAALRADKLDVVLLHRAADLARGGGAVVDTLRSLVEQGVVGLWGVSLSSPAELVTVLSQSGVRHIQLPFNVLDRRWLEPSVIDVLTARPDVHVTVRSVLLQGLLASADARRWPDAAGPHPERILTLLKEIVTALGRRDRLDLCLAYVLAHPWVDDIVLSARRVPQLRELAETVTRPPLSGDEVAAVHAVIPPGSLDLVDPSRWTYIRGAP